MTFFFPDVRERERDDLPRAFFFFIRIYGERKRGQARVATRRPHRILVIASEFIQRRVSREFTCYVNPCTVPRARVDQLTSVVFIAPSRFKAGGRREWAPGARLFDD